MNRDFKKGIQFTRIGTNFHDVWVRKDLTMLLAIAAGGGIGIFLAKALDLKTPDLFFKILGIGLVLLILADIKRLIWSKKTVTVELDDINAFEIAENKEAVWKLEYDDPSEKDDENVLKLPLFEGAYTIKYATPNKDDSKGSSKGYCVISGRPSEDFFALAKHLFAKDERETYYSVSDLSIFVSIEDSQYQEFAKNSEAGVNLQRREQENHPLSKCC